MSKRSTVCLRVALVGTEHPHAALLLRTFQNLPEIAEVIVWTESKSVSAAMAGAGHKILRTTRNLASLLSDETLDFVVVCVRTDRATEIAKQVILAGKPLLIDKPAGLTSREVRQLDELARQRRVKACVLYGQRAHPAIHAGRRLVRAGRLGQLLTVEARLITTQVRFRNPESWLFSRAHARGGILSWLGCHYLDLIPHLIEDEITAVSAQFATRSGAAIDVEDVAAVILKFRSGAIGTLHTGYVLAQRGSGYGNPAGFDNYIACNGQDGRLVWRGTASRSLHVEGNAASASGGALRFRLRKTDSYGGAVGERFVHQFIAALRHGTEVPATLADAARVLRIIEAAQRSARSGRQESVNV